MTKQQLQSKRRKRLIALVITIVVVAVLGPLTFAAFAQTDLLRQEVQVVERGESQLNSTWWIRTWKNGLHTQAYIFFETTTGEWRELNLTAGPTVKVGKLELAFPMGVRFHPYDGWELSHAIGKLNGFGAFGDWRVLFINDLSIAMEDGVNEHEHFFQYQLVRHPQGNRFGYGVQSDAYYLGSTEASWTVGPIFRATYLSAANDVRVWDGTLELYPFYSPTNDGYGVKINFLNFRFGGS
jgi:hypothetical protein